MRIKVLLFTVAAFIGVAVAPLAHAYPNCAAARAAGAAPLTADNPATARNSIAMATA
ncbi:Hypothetical protein ERS075544_02831 [Mycobacteroides abscessus]|nr:Hypothetical protein ERS075544_02831 [Mycobacteroides abscessus]